MKVYCYWFAICIILRHGWFSRSQKTEIKKESRVPNITVYDFTLAEKEICETKLQILTDQNGNCYHQIVTSIIKLLKELKVKIKKEDVGNVGFFKKCTIVEGVTVTRMEFNILLNLTLKHAPNLDKKFTEQKYFQKQMHHVRSIFSENQIKSVQKASIKVISKNLKKIQKSQILIRVVIDVKQNGFLEAETDVWTFKLIGEGILNWFLQRNKWKKKHLHLETFDSSSTYFGSVLSVMASSLCGLSFVLKKRSLLKVDKKIAYYLNKGWWMAHSLMVIGDVLHFVAFFFTPAVLVCTLQMLMILVTAIASSRILGEKINSYWKLGFASSLGGCSVIIAHIPKEPHIRSIEIFLYMVTTPTFVAYNIILILVTIMMMHTFIPKWGQVNPLAYTIQGAIFGSIAVVALKGVLLVFTDKFFHWLPLSCLVVFGTCLLLQLEYLNKALSYYNTLVVATQYYVLYSALVILASFILFEVWKSSSDETILVISLGFATATLGVLIFVIFQEDNATFDFSKLFAGPDTN